MVDSILQPIEGGQFAPPPPQEIPIDAVPLEPIWPELLETAEDFTTFDADAQEQRMQDWSDWNGWKDTLFNWGAPDQLENFIDLNQAAAFFINTFGLTSGWEKWWIFFERFPNSLKRDYVRYLFLCVIPGPARARVELDYSVDRDAQFYLRYPSFDYYIRNKVDIFNDRFLRTYRRKKPTEFRRELLDDDECI